MDNEVHYVGLSYCANTPETKTLYVGINVTSSPGSLVIDTSNDQINTLNSRPNDINQPALPEIYKKLTSEQAKKGFETFWQLVQRIKSNPNAHKISSNKRLITTEPLELSNFFEGLKTLQSNDFHLEEFLQGHTITLREALLDGANLNNALLYDADLNGAVLNCSTQFNRDTKLLNIKCSKINFTETYNSYTITITDQEKIRDKFIELGAKNENISFAQAA